MANMSYCRFQNTVGDLADCLDAIQHPDDGDLSEEEAAAKDRLVRLCRKILAAVDEE